MKQTFASQMFAADWFKSGMWTGIGEAVVPYGNARAFAAGIYQPGSMAAVAYHPGPKAAGVYLPGSKFGEG